MLMRCIRAENRKLRRSPIWLLFLAVPAISAIYGTFNYRMNQGILTHGWYDLWTQYTLFYALFFFAPLIGVYAAYLWRLEHRGHNWNLIMTAPVRPFALYAAKFCAMAKMAFLTQGWLLVLFLVGGKLGAGLAASRRRKFCSGFFGVQSEACPSLPYSFCCPWSSGTSPCRC